MYRRAGDYTTPAPPREVKKAQPPPRPPAPPRPQRPPPAPTGLLQGLDKGDIMLLAVLLFLYLESRDEDFLVILIVMGISLFKKS